MANKFLVVIESADQAGANQRLTAALSDSGFDDDCGVLNSMHCIDTADDITAVFQRLSTKIDPTDRLVIAPIVNPWAAQQAPTMEDCGRLSSQIKKRKEPAGAY